MKDCFCEQVRMKRSLMQPNVSYCHTLGEMINYMKINIIYLINSGVTDELLANRGLQMTPD